jgi:hypothetical protein
MLPGLLLLSMSLRQPPGPMSKVSACSRRSFALGATGILVQPARPCVADEPDDFNLRTRGNKPPLVPGDYYYTFGTIPPRRITAPKIDQPQWNAFGACVENSCTYVPIAQRYQAYAKYEPRLSRGLREYQRTILGAIRASDFDALAQATARGSGSDLPAPAVDALLKAALLASQLLVSPNNVREKKQCSLALFYVNEASYALDLLAVAAAHRDANAAAAAWQFGRDSWNSYLAVVNPSIVPKVGDPLELIEEIAL